MCINVSIDGLTISDLAGIREYLGREPVYYDPDAWMNDRTPGDFCLCGVDHDATSKLIGRRAQIGDWGDTEYVKTQEG